MKPLLALAFLPISVTAYAQSAPWDSLDNKGALYAGTRDDKGNSVLFVCPVTGAAKLIVKSEQFRVSVPNEHRYTLTFGTDRGRSQVTAVAQDSELHFEASDLNAKVNLERLMEDISASKSFTIAMSPFGWKGAFTAEGAAAALKPLIAGC